jgi:hypothetical protein
MTSAMISLEAECQWFTFTPTNASTNPISVSAGTAICPDSWEPYYVSEVALRVALNMFPSERWQQYTKQRDTDRIRAFESFSRIPITTAPDGTIGGYIHTLQTVRNYCVNHCLRLKPSFMPAIDSIDAANDEALTYIWNKGKWGFRRRQATFRVTRTDFGSDGLGTWTNSTKVIGALSGIIATIPVGTRVYITGGTSATGTILQDEYTVASNNTTTITLNNSITSDGSNATAITGFYYTVDVNGLETNEVFDSFASNYLHGEGDNGTPSEMRWSDGDAFAKYRSESEITTGAPVTFRSVQTGTTHTLLFWPAPDQSYRLRGEVIVKQPSLPTAVAGTFSQFATEFHALIRRLTLCRLLTNSGRHDENLFRQVTDEIETMLPGYQEIGPVADRTGPVDVFGDIDDLSGGSMNVGGMI